MVCIISAKFQSLREKCPNTEFLLVCIFLYSVQIQENTDQKNSIFEHFSRSECWFSCYRVKFKVSRIITADFSDVNRKFFRFFWSVMSTKSYWFQILIPVWKISKYGVSSGLYFPAFWLITKNDSVNLRIQLQ